MIFGEKHSKLLEEQPPIIFNAKAARNREKFVKHNARKEITEDGARLKIAKGHIIEAKGYEALQFFSTHHDYRRGLFVLNMKM